MTSERNEKNLDNAFIVRHRMIDFFPGELISHKGIVDGGCDFWVHIPEFRVVGDTTKNLAVIFLHGTSICRNDLIRVRLYGCLDAIARGADIEAVVIDPQNKGGARIYLSGRKGIIQFI